MANSPLHFNVDAKEGATVSRISESKTPGLYYVDVAIIGATLSGQANGNVVEGIAEGQRVDVRGDIEISEFNNQKRYRFHFHSMTAPAAGRASASSA
ncbi:hypothetical protein Pan241w_22170 [Gimesia alba]|uniref:Uncharacterized protein n=1 Tax=Gimesia alba TaxID=2527973 RepID=A0A517RE51_9PLAN|nr:hypothetical protein [Gimesia alba]QDT42136.1 hypothetical protein Pan241w_22170 [Gimesia alba]